MRVSDAARIRRAATSEHASFFYEIDSFQVVFQSQAQSIRSNIRTTAFRQSVFRLIRKYNARTWRKKKQFANFAEILNMCRKPQVKPRITYQTNPSHDLLKYRFNYYFFRFGPIKIRAPVITSITIPPNIVPSLRSGENPVCTAANGTETSEFSSEGYLALLLALSKASA
jgi:hypothetical protein